jgi:Abortive infection C-terminus
LVEEYYAGINWSDAVMERKALAAYKHILQDADENLRPPLVEALRGDGYEVNDTLDILNRRPPEALAAYERRIQAALQNNDPELAVGTAKELVEAACRQLLSDAHVVPDPTWTVEKVYKEAAKTIALDVDAVPDQKPGAESIKKVLRGLALVVSGTAELRNRFGTGHGRHRRSGLQLRHAELVTGASVTIARFLLATRTAHSSRSNR